jgi:hypothetical protein
MDISSTHDFPSLFLQSDTCTAHQFWRIVFDIHWFSLKKSGMRLIACYLAFVLVQAWIQNWITYGVLDMVIFFWYVGILVLF